MGLTSLGSAWGGMMTGNFKPIGSSQRNVLTDDNFLTMVGAGASVANCLARIMWGYLLDRFPFKILIIINISLSLFVSLTM
jgi:MFS family permease